MFRQKHVDGLWGNCNREELLLHQKQTSMVCGVIVTEKNSCYTRNKLDHIHAPDLTRESSSVAITEVRPAGISQPYNSAKSVVSSSIRNLGLTSVEQMNMDYLARRVNRARQNCRPEEPTDLDFELQTEHLPEDFFKADLWVEGRRHLVFATDHQLDLLKQSKTWYMDGTFKKIKRVLQPDNLRRIVIDFEAAIWNACRTTFPDVDIQGCGFHWGQVVFGYVQSLGLTTEYLNHTGSYSFIRQLLCLPLLPHEHIVPTFEAMRDFNTAPHLDPLLSYIDRTWMRSTVWPVQSWSVFGKVVRTNNDVEGWHRRLNTRTGTVPPFYQLIQTLFNDSKEIDNEIYLVSEQPVMKLKRKNKLHGDTKQSITSMVRLQRWNPHSLMYVEEM